MGTKLQNWEYTSKIGNKTFKLGTKLGTKYFCKESKFSKLGRKKSRFEAKLLKLEQNFNIVNNLLNWEQCLYILGTKLLN